MCAIRGAQIGMIFQEPMTALNPVQTSAAQVTETLRLHAGLRGAGAGRGAREAGPRRVAGDRRAGQVSRTNCPAASASVW